MPWPHIFRMGISLVIGYFLALDNNFNFLRSTKKIQYSAKNKLNNLKYLYFGPPCMVVFSANDEGTQTFKMLIFYKSYFDSLI